MNNADQVYKDLCDIVGEEYVFRNEPMSRHTTLRVGGPAEIFVIPDKHTLPLAGRYCRKHLLPVFFMGNGSNLVCGDGGIDAVVIDAGERVSSIEVHDEYILADAGALLSSVASVAAQEGLTGFEFASGIPGTIGGAVVINAGAYGGEMKDVVSDVTALNETGEVRVAAANDLGFGYRESLIPTRNWLVLSVLVRLQKGRKDDILARMEELKEERNAKQPLDVPSAGSTFKRPEGQFAGKLIEDAGLSGYRVGGAQVSEKHCGFVINTGDATSEDIVTLVTYIQDVVKEKFGVALQPEVKFVGRF